MLFILSVFEAFHAFMLWLHWAISFKAKLRHKTTQHAFYDDPVSVHPSTASTPLPAMTIAKQLNPFVAFPLDCFLIKKHNFINGGGPQKLFAEGPTICLDWRDNNKFSIV